jgi:hypothetical protein
MFTKKFGVEIEFAGANYNEVSRQMRRDGLDVSVHDNWHQDLWVAKSDGSIESDSDGECENYDEDYGTCGDCEGCCGDGGCELVSPPMFFGERAKESIRKTVASAVRAGGYVNYSCGLHVHVNANFVRRWNTSRANRFFDHLCTLYREYEESFDSRMDIGRQGNRNNYCYSMHEWRSGNGSRYFKLNTTAFRQHGTVEFRHHHGTLNAEEIIEWVKTCLLFFNIAKESFLHEEFKAEFFGTEVSSVVPANSTCVPANI